jgi:hypothetical protein
MANAIAILGKEIMAKNKWSEKVKNIRITDEEISSLSEFYHSPYYSLLQRIAARMISTWKDQSFRLNEFDPHFALKHNQYVERAFAIGMFLRFVEQMATRLEAEEETPPAEV